MPGVSMSKTQAWLPPRGEIPVNMAARAVLTQTEDSALWIALFEVFSGGVGITLKSAHRDDAERTPQVPLGRVGGIRLGCVWPDGSEVIGRRTPPDPTGASARPVLIGGTTGWGWGHFRHHFWMRPIPERGDIVFVADWPERGLPEGSARFDSEPFGRASREVVKIWHAPPPVGTVTIRRSVTG
jgi:hypothetical protein